MRPGPELIDDCRDIARRPSRGNRRRAASIRTHVRSRSTLPVTRIRREASNRHAAVNCGAKLI